MISYSDYPNIFRVLGALTNFKEPYWRAEQKCKFRLSRVGVQVFSEDGIYGSPVGWRIDTAQEAHEILLTEGLYPEETIPRAAWQEQACERCFEYGECMWKNHAERIAGHYSPTWKTMVPLVMFAALGDKVLKMEAIAQELSEQSVLSMSWSYRPSHWDAFISKEQISRVDENISILFSQLNRRCAIFGMNSDQLRYV